LLAILLLLIATGGCSGTTLRARSLDQLADARSAASVGHLPTRPDSAAARGYQIQPGDELEIKFFYAPELNGRLVVPPTGDIALPLIGEVSTTSRTAGELGRVISEAYRAHMARSDATVNFLSLAPRSVFVGGEVHTPGLVQLQPPLTVTQAIFSAGGPKYTAQMEKVVVISQQPGGVPQHRVVDVDAMLAGKADPGGLQIEAYDVVFVPKTGVAKAGQFVQSYVRDLWPFLLSIGIIVAQ
jgi:polysaccharide export outer membrane protein